MSWLFAALAGCRSFEGDDPAECENFLDDDQDGNVDCSDEDCVQSPTCRPWERGPQPTTTTPAPTTPTPTTPVTTDSACEDTLPGLGPQAPTAALADLSLGRFVPSGLLTAAVPLGDPDGDGRVEVAMGQYDPSAIWVFEAPFVGELRAAQATSVLHGGGAWLAVADLTGDDAADLVSWSYGDASVIPLPVRAGDRQVADELVGELEASIYVGHVGLGDLDLDGRSELLTTEDHGEVRAYRGQILGSRARESWDAKYDLERLDAWGDSGATLVLPDLDGDGVAEILIGASGIPDLDGDGDDRGGLVLMRGAPGSYTAPDALAVIRPPCDEELGDAQILVSDLTGDGLPDVVTIGRGYHGDTPVVRILGRLGAARGAIGIEAVQTARIVPSFDNPFVDFGEVLASADVDGDGADDLLLQYADDVLLFLGPFAGDRSTADAAIRVRDAQDPRAVGDLDGDGIGDFAFSTELVSGAALRGALP